MIVPVFTLRLFYEDKFKIWGNPVQTLIDIYHI